MIERLLHEALDAKAAEITPHGHPRTENIRRIAAHRRRFRGGLILGTAAAAALLVTLPHALHGTATHPIPDPSHPAQAGPDKFPDKFPDLSQPAQPSPDTLPADLDPAYRPTSDVVRIDGVDMWFAGNQLCWRRPTGGGWCGDRTRPFANTQVAVVGVRDQRLLPDGRSHSVIFGTAPSPRTKITLTTGRRVGRNKTTVVPVAGATLYTNRAFPHPIWSMVVNEEAAGGPMEELSVNGAKPSPLGPLGALWDPTIEPVPLTIGTRLFQGQSGWVYVYRDGDSAGFGSPGHIRWFGLGERDSFGGVSSQPDGPAGTWYYGLLAPQMTTLRAETGGTANAAQIVAAGSAKAFAVRVPAGAHGYLVGYDANGKQINTWKI